MYDSNKLLSFLLIIANNMSLGRRCFVLVLYLICINYQQLLIVFSTIMKSRFYLHQLSSSSLGYSVQNTQHHKSSKDDIFGHTEKR